MCSCLGSASHGLSELAFLPAAPLPSGVRDQTAVTSSRRQPSLLAMSTRVQASYALRQSLALLGAATKRGALATSAQRRRAKSIVEELALLSDTEDSETEVSGRYELIWASTPSTFRSSIFFWAFQQAFSDTETRSKAVAGVFRVTGSLPGVHVHSAIQDVSADEVRSVVDLEIFPGLRGDVVSTGRLANPMKSGESGEVRVETTRVEKSNYIPVPAVWAAPVGQILDLVGGGSSDGATAKFRVVYAGEAGYAIRVPGRSDGGEDLFVYEAVASWNKTPDR